jgi:hypothetical protein
MDWSRILAYVTGTWTRSCWRGTNIWPPKTASWRLSWKVDWSSERNHQGKGNVLLFKASLEQFLNGTTTASCLRSYSDTIFAEINALLSQPAINRIRFLRNKFIAHASDATSRSGDPLSGLSLSIANVEDALRPLVRAYHRLASDVLWGMGSGDAVMPTAQFDPLEGLVEALTSEQKEHLLAFWNELVETHNRWHEEPS